jgi:antitoxin component of MazEF toxin-antitoxin module
MLIQTFSALLIKPESVGAWTYIEVPFDVEKTYQDSGHVKVRGTLNGAAFRTVVSPKGDGSYYMIVSKKILKAANAAPGDEVTVEIQHDTEPRTITIPVYLQQEFDRNPIAKDKFDNLAYTHKKYFAQWITDCKRETTSIKRAKKAIEMILEGRNLKY